MLLKLTFALLFFKKKIYIFSFLKQFGVRSRAPSRTLGQIQTLHLLGTHSSQPVNAKVSTCTAGLASSCDAYPNLHNALRAPGFTVQAPPRFTPPVAVVR